MLLAPLEEMIHPRVQYHLDGKAKMSRDDYTGALDTLLKGQEKYGPHLLLNADIVCCYYMLNDFQNYQRRLSDLKIDFQKYTSQISDQTFIGAGLALGLLLEESGQLAEALDIYQLTLEKERFYHGKWRSQAAVLRLMAFFDLHSPLLPLYQSHENIPLAADAQVDIQHALMLADVSLFGLTPATTRAINFLKQNNIKESDRRLFIFDLYFEALKSGKDLSPELKKLISQMNYWDLDNYEKALYDVLQQREGFTALSPLDSTRSEQLSRMGAIRYLFIIYKLNITDEQNSFIREKLLFLTNSLDVKTKTYIQTSWMSETENQIYLSLNTPQRILKSSLQSLSLQNNPSYISFLSLFNQKSSLDADWVIQKIFETDFNENSTTRLRMLISRLNKKIDLALGINKTFQLSKLKVHMNSQIKLDIS